MELPKKGKFQFRFHSNDFIAFTSYPARITERHNTITIRLENKGDDDAPIEFINHLGLKDISNLSNEELEKGMALGTINFIVHGLVAPNADAVNFFKTEYGIGFLSENCSVDPISFKIAMNINKKLELYLNSKYGNAWINQLPATPFGLQLDRF